MTGEADLESGGGLWARDIGMRLDFSPVLQHVSGSSHRARFLFVSYFGTWPTCSHDIRLGEQYEVAEISH